MIRVSLQKFLDTKSSHISLLQSASRTFGFWDMSKSRHKNSQESLKQVQLFQSPIDIKDADSEFDRDLKCHFHYTPVKVHRDVHHHGQLVLDVEHLGHLDVHVPNTKGLV